MITLTILILLAMLVVMSAAWVFQRRMDNGGWADVFWTYGTGLTCAVAALAPASIDNAVSWRQWLVATLVAVWSIRLGTYVAIRVAHGREDVRYAVIRRDWGRSFQRNMFGLLIIQAPVSAALGIAILFAAHQPDQRFRPTDIAGLVILIGAVVGEGIADGQMTRFKADLANHGKVCDRGLWAWSRHPNYFFEILIWVAFPVMGISLARPWSLLSLGAPIVMFLLIRYVSGVPPLEAAMLESKGDAYRRYQQRVAVMLPWRPNH
jgi:steroid 5-alpha reductase family enzyme